MRTRTLASTALIACLISPLALAQDTEVEKASHRIMQVDIEGMVLSPGGKKLAYVRQGKVHVSTIEDLFRNGRKEIGERKASGELKGTKIRDWYGTVKRRVTLKGKNVVATDKDGNATVLIAESALAKICRGPLGEVRIRSVQGAGKSLSILLEISKHWPVLPPRTRGGRRILEKAPRGWNPGSSEPGPPLPSWMVLYKGGKLQPLARKHLARYCDELEVLPGKGMDKFLFLQMAQRGGAQNAHSPETWIGTINDKGQKDEVKLVPTPFPAAMKNYRWIVLDQSDDATRGLVLVLSTISVVKKYATRMAAAMAFARSGLGRATHIVRPGEDRKGTTLTLKYPAISLWGVNTKTQTFKRLSMVFAYGIPGEEGKIIRLPGMAGHARHRLDEAIAYSRAAGVLAVPLQYNYTRNLKPVGLLLIRIPRW